jgi:hypothetical protein
MKTAQLEALSAALLETNTPDSDGAESAAEVIGKLEAEGDRMALLILGCTPHPLVAFAARESIALRGVQVQA